MRLVSMLYFNLRQNFDSTSPLFSRYMSWKGECVFEEQQGGGAETLSWIEAEHENYPIYASAGYPKKWTIQNRYRLRYAEIRISPTVSVSNGRRLTG
jgi:hypothetical protein